MLTIAGVRLLASAEEASSDRAVDIVVEGDRITAIQPTGAGERRGEVLDAAGLLAVPGLVNGHQHSHELLFKGRSENLPLELWMNSVWPLRSLPLTARQVYLRTAAVAIEALRSGTTTICDDVAVDPVGRPDHLEAVLAAYEAVGIRALVGPTLFDRPFFRALPFVDESFPPELLRRLDAAAAAAAPSPDRVLAALRELAQGRQPHRSRVGVIAAPSAPQRCTDGFLRAVRALADNLDLPVIIHVHETRLQVVTGQLFYGCSMVEHLDRLGFLGPGTSLIHGVWLTDTDLAILARTGTTLQHNPASNLKLGSGIAPLQAALAAGVNVSLGSDGCGSIETVSMQLTLTLAAMLHKIRGPHGSWPGAAQAFRAATLGGAVALGLADRIGSLAVGKAADIALYSLGTTPFTPLNDPLRQLVHGQAGPSLASLVVDGKVVLRDGKLTRVDEAALLAELADAHRGLLGDIARSEAELAPLLPCYERILDRCALVSIPEAVHPARLP